MLSHHHVPRADPASGIPWSPKVLIAKLAKNKMNESWLIMNGHDYASKMSIHSDFIVCTQASALINEIVRLESPPKKRSKSDSMILASESLRRARRMYAA